MLDEPRYRLKEVAQLTGKADGLTPKGIRSRHQQLRGLMDRGFLPKPARTGDGETSAVLFTGRDVLRIAVFLTLRDFLFDLEMLRQVDASMRHEKVTLSPTGAHYRYSFDTAIEQISHAEQWVLDIYLLRDPRSGDTFVQALCAPEPQRRVGVRHPAYSAAIDVVVGVTTLPLNAIVAPVVDLLTEHVG